MKIYLAHNFAAREYLKSIIKLLEDNSHTITSRWITDDEHLKDSHAMLSAVHDLEDVEAASDLILFANQFADSPGAGKFVELGYALRAGKRIIVIGDGRCVFYNLPNIRHAKTIEEALVLL